MVTNRYFGVIFTLSLNLLALNDLRILNLCLNSLAMLILDPDALH